MRALNTAAAALREYADSPRAGIDLAVQAFAHLDLPETREALGSLLFRDPYLKAFIPVASSDPRTPDITLAFSRGQHPVLVVALNDKLEIRAPGNLAKPVVVDNHPDRIASFAGDDRVVAIASQGKDANSPYIRIVNRGTAKRAPHVSTSLSHISKMSLVDGGQRLIGLAAFEGLGEWDLRDGRERMIESWREMCSQLSPRDHAAIGV